MVIYLSICINRERKRKQRWEEGRCGRRYGRIRKKKGVRRWGRWEEEGKRRKRHENGRGESRKRWKEEEVVEEGEKGRGEGEVEGGRRLTKKKRGNAEGRRHLHSQRR